MRDLREAASQSPELAATLAQLGANTIREQLKAAIGVILQQWADSANFSDSFETADAQHKDLFFIPPGASALDAYNARYAGPLGAYSGVNNGSPNGLSLTNDIQAKFDNIRNQQDRIERLLKTLEAFIAEFGYSGGTHIDAAGQAYDPVTGIVRISGFVLILMQARTGLAEKDRQYFKQAANDKKWRIAA